MKRVLQTYLIAALAFCSIAFSAWKVTWFQWEASIPGQSSELSAVLVDSAKSLELVVFGGSWTDGAVFRRDSIGHRQSSNSTIPRKAWSENLCDTLDCLYRDYARIEGYNSTSTNSTGPLVEVGLYTESNFEQTQESRPRSDLKDQIKQYSTDNGRRQAILAEANTSSKLNQTIYVLDFGLWDIWKVAERETRDAEHIVITSVDIIFASLDYLSVTAGISNNGTTAVRAILPMVVDLTFLPGYSKDVEVEKKTVSLVKLWNQKLVERAEGWHNGELFLYDTNSFMLQHIREQQMVAVNRENQRRDTSTPPTFSVVTSSCLNAVENTTATNDLSGAICSSPDDYLFWDDVHFTPKAHQLIAQEMIRDLSSRGGWT